MLKLFASIYCILFTLDFSKSISFIVFCLCLTYFLFLLQIFDAIGLGDLTHLMNSIVTKLCNNIKFWSRNDEILKETLDVLVELISNYSSSKTLLGLDTVNFIVHNHTGQHFPFLGYDNDNKYRVTFYSALSRLVFSSSEDLNNSFDLFILPNIEILRQLSQQNNLRQIPIRLAIIGALRDLRGITASTYNKRTYNLLFDTLYPDFFPLFVKIAEIWYDDPIVMTALLKFLHVSSFFLDHLFVYSWIF